MQFQDDLAAGIVLVRPALQSPDFLAGVSGWAIRIDGSAEFNDVVVRGTLESSNYVPGVSGWQLDDGGSAEFNDISIRGTGTAEPIIIGPDSGPQVRIGSNAANGYVRFPTNRPDEGTLSQVISGVGNSGAVDEYASLQLSGPGMAGAADDSIRVHLDSQPLDGSGEATFAVLYNDGTGILANLLLANRNFVQVVDRRFTVTGVNSTSSALFVNTDAAHTGNLLRLMFNSADRLVVNAAGDLTLAGDADVAGALTVAGDADVAGVLTAANIQSGSFSITPTVANEWTANSAIVFPAAFATAPVVMLTCTAGGPGSATTTELEMCAASITTTGFNARIRRGNLTNTTLSWLAIST